MFCTQTLIDGDGIKYPKVTYINYGRGWSKVLGYILKCGSKYWSWNSFKIVPYLSDQNHAETFQTIDAAKNWADKLSLHGDVVMLTNKGDPSDIFKAA